MIQMKEINTPDKAVPLIPNSDALNTYLDNSGIDSSLTELVKIRAAQLNNCEYCTDIHIHQAKTNGLSKSRISGLNIWSDIPFYSTKERAALALTEVLTRFSEKNINEELYEEVSSYLSNKELTVLSNAISSINNWKQQNHGGPNHRFI